MGEIGKRKFKRELLQSLETRESFGGRNLELYVWSRETFFHTIANVGRRAYIIRSMKWKGH